MKYTAKGEHHRNFELFDENNNSLGMIGYDGWFSMKVKITQGSSQYHVESANFWHTELQVKKGDEVAATIKFGWGGMSIDYQGKTYMFKAGMWHNKFSLVTDTDHAIITLKPDFQWTKFSFNYQIETDDNYTEGKSALLILILIYCCNQMQAMAGSVGGAVV